MIKCGLDDLLAFLSLCYSLCNLRISKLLFSLFFSLPFKVGAVVEAKTPDGQFMEGVITKLTDASVYTVGKHEWIFPRYLSFLHKKSQLPPRIEPK